MSRKRSEKGIKNAVNAANKVFKDWGKRVKQLSEIIAEDREEFQKEYERLLPKMEAYLSSKNLVHPSTPEEAYKIFIFGVIDEDDLEDLFRSPEQRDIKKICELITNELDRDLSDDILKRIKAFADQGKEVNKPQCIALITEFEKGFKVWGGIKKKSVIVRGIKKEGVLKEFKTIPTDKTLKDWIDSYRTQFYPKYFK